MAAVIEPPRQFKQPSRKGKKAWRKNVDITELQEGLENVREEVIKGCVPSLRDFFLPSAWGLFADGFCFQWHHR